ncbi:MAG TPA: D-alanine--D-alanine ligase family protein [Vicinamibacterales bacterium]|jgi:D-alanine-D-alanine ligase
MKKMRVGVLYGGRSGEHEISLASAAAVIAHLDPARYETVPIRIEKDGRWRVAARPPESIKASEVIEASRGATARTEIAEREAYLAPCPGDTTFHLDVMFPVLHGPYGEDGTVQGLLELADVPYVGAGVLGSAVGMDKAAMKLVFAASGLPIVKHETVLRRDWLTDTRGLVKGLIASLGLPVFVKPANLGSSVGISKVKTEDQLAPAMDLAAGFDRKIVIEAAVPNAREIECGVLGNDRPNASIPGEIRPPATREFYDYEAKYLDEASETIIPAPLSPAQVVEVQRLAVAAFRAIDAAGFARVDFLLNRQTGDLYLNEVNTIPGFTTISMFPKLWEASGLCYSELLDRLIELALERHAEKQELK